MRDMSNITVSDGQFDDCKTSQDVWDINDTCGVLDLFHVMLEFNQKAINAFSASVHHKGIKVYFSSSSLSDLPKRRIKLNSSQVIWLKQTLKYLG